MIFNNQQNQESVIQLCCQVCNVEVDQFLSKSRKGKVVLARQMACKVFRDEMRLTLREIGVIVSARHPKHYSTVINALRVFDNYMDTDDERTVTAYDHVCRQLKAIIQGTNSITIHYTDEFPINKLKSFLRRHKNNVFHAEKDHFLDVDLELKSKLI